MSRYLWGFAMLALAACKEDPIEETPDDTDDTPDVWHSEIMRDCQAAVGDICPFAGAGLNGYNGEGNDRHDTLFSFPMSATFSPLGPVAIADWNNHKIRALNDDGTIDTVMGTGFLGDGDPAAADRTEGGADGTTVNLNHPTMQQYFSDGTLLSASWHTHKLRTWDQATGKVHVVLGSAPGFAPPELVDDRTATGPAGVCQLNQPKSVEIDASDMVYILDMRNERIRKWDPVSGTVQTIAGSGVKGVVGAEGCPDGTAISTCFNFPKNSNPEPGGAMALNDDETIMYIADTESHVIRAIDLTDGTISTIAGTPGTAGFADGAAATAMFSLPTDVEIDGDTLFVADANNHRIRAIDLTTMQVTTFAGTGEPTCPHEGAALAVVCAEQALAGDGAPATSATLYRPFGIDLDLDGNLVIADTYNHRFRIVYR